MELAKRIDSFFEPVDNLPLPIFEALRLTAMEANGADPTVIENEIAAGRYVANQPQP